MRFCTGWPIWMVLAESLKTGFADAVRNSDAVDSMTLGAITDTVMQYHRGEPFELPRVITPRPIEPGTTYIKL